MGSAVTDPRANAMPTTPPPPSRLRRPRGRPGGRLRALARTAPAGLAVALGLALAGCGQQPAASGPRMELDTATVNSSQGSSPIDAYLVIRNNGATDQLISARSSAGGTVTLSGPAGGNPAAMRAVAAITVPGHTLIRLVPNGYHLIITDSGPMKSGTEITLTLRFAHAGTYQVAAEVTNPQTGGSSYFLN
jgi:copper(I)-binding protein